ncbi:MAG: alpha/beta hydrolase [Polyangia bacterium]
MQLATEERGDGRPVLFIHGLTFDHHLLLETSEPVFASRRARRLYVDLPGHGLTPPDPRCGSAEALVEVLASFVDHACTSPPIVVGHSYGGYLALGLASVRQLAGLVLVTPVVEPDPARRTVAPRRVVRPAPLHFSTSGEERETYEEIAVLQTPSTLAAYQRLVHPASERTDRQALEAIRTRYVLPWAVVSRLDVQLPTLVVCGRDDHWAGYEDALPIVRALPHAELEVLPDAGQLLPIEAGERWRFALGRFVDATAGS